MPDLISMPSMPEPAARVKRGKHVRALLAAVAAAGGDYQRAAHCSRAQLARMLSRCGRITAEAPRHKPLTMAAKCPPH